MLPSVGHQLSIITSEFIHLTYTTFLSYRSSYGEDSLVFLGNNNNYDLICYDDTVSYYQMYSIVLLEQYCVTVYPMKPFSHTYFQVSVKWISWVDLNSPSSF